LTPLIISKQGNRTHRFNNVIEFDLESNELIVVEKNKINLPDLTNERNKLILMFSNYMNKISPKKIVVNKIPKKIFQTWETKDLEPEFQKIVDTWKINNPEYEYYLFDKEERVQFLKDNFDKSVLDTYNSIVPGANKADLYRYCYLYIHGGVYVDVDSLCIGKLNDFLLPNSDFVVPIDLNTNPYEGEHNLACGFIASIAKHPILLNCINQIVHNVKNNIHFSSPLDFTGPGILGRSVNKYIGKVETHSFKGKEGLFTCGDQGRNIHFLKFEQKDEYIKDINNNILFQNKNGNHDIIRLYNNECRKIKDHVCWVRCPIDKRFITTPKKNIVLMVYGQFRTYKKNLRNNLKMLEPIFKNHNIHVFLLTDKKSEGNYSIKAEEEIKDIFKEFNFTIHLFDYIENYNEYEENATNKGFFNNIKHRKGVDNDFVPNLIYRKYFLNKLKNEYITKNKMNIDLTVFSRVFDIIITNNLSLNLIENEIEKVYNDNNVLLGSADTFFIGSQQTMDYLFSLSARFKDGNIYHDTIWEDSNFVNFVSSMDSCLCKCRATYSPEIQSIAHMYYSSYTYKNIRVDYNNPETPLNKNFLYNIYHDPYRFDNANIDIII